MERSKSYSSEDEMEKSS